MVGPRIDEWRLEVSKAQSGACFRCSQRRRLYLATSEQDVVALCLPCHEDWRRR
jgi:hypothetical protein